jgi:hypothetical protein
LGLWPQLDEVWQAAPMQFCEKRIQMAVVSERDAELGKGNATIEEVTSIDVIGVGVQAGVMSDHVVESAAQPEVLG